VTAVEVLGTGVVLAPPPLGGRARRSQPRPRRPRRSGWGATLRLGRALQVVEVGRRGSASRRGGRSQDHAAPPGATPSPARDRRGSRARRGSGGGRRDAQAAARTPGEPHGRPGWRGWERPAARPCTRGAMSQVGSRTRHPASTGGAATRWPAIRPGATPGPRPGVAPGGGPRTRFGGSPGPSRPRSPVHRRARHHPQGPVPERAGAGDRGRPCPPAPVRRRPVGRSRSTPASRRREQRGTHERGGGL